MEGVTITFFGQALNHYAYGDGEAATIGQNVIQESLATTGYSNMLSAIINQLSSASANITSGSITVQSSFSWDQGYILGRNSMNFYTRISWTASPWQKEGNKYIRTITGIGNIVLSTQDRWDFEPHTGDSIWETLKREYGPSVVANLYSTLISGSIGEAYDLSGQYLQTNKQFSIKQYE